MRTCLILEGGALRGIYTAGVLDELQKENIKIDTIIGVSMGSLIGVNYVSKQAGRAIRYNLKYCIDSNYIGLKSLLKTKDIVNKRLAYYELPNKLDKFDYKTYKKSKIHFLATVTNLETGKAEYIEIKDAKKDVEYLRAGSSMPLVSQIVKIGKNEYLDGGIADSIPLEKALKDKYDKIIVVLTRPVEYRKKKANQILFKIKYRKYPEFVKSLENRSVNYNKTVEKIINLEKENKIFVIRPSRKVGIKRIEHNRRKILEQYNLGIEDFKNRREELLNYLK